MITIKNLSLRKKFLFSFLSLALIVFASGAVGVLINKWVGHKIQSTLKATAAQEKRVLLMEVDLKICQVYLLEATKVMSDRDKFQELSDDYHAKKETFRSYVNILLKGNTKLEIPPAAKGSTLEKRIVNVEKSWGEFEDLAEKILNRKKSLLSAGSAGLTDGELYRLSGDLLTETVDGAKLSVDELLLEVGVLATQARKDVENIQMFGNVLFLVVTVLAIGLAILLGTVLSKFIIKRMNRMTNALASGAQGDLETRLKVDSTDELGQLSGDFNLMADKLSEMLGKVQRSTTELNHVASNLFNTSRHVIDASEMQAHSVDETSSAVTQINVSIKGVATAMDSLSLSASESSSSILEMAASIEEVALNVETLADSVEEVSASIIQMAASIKQIGFSVQSLMDASTTTASSVAEMDSSIREIEKNAKDTADISESVRKDAEIGKDAVDAAITGMTEIRQSSFITSEVIQTLSDRVNDIGAILSVIDEVAEQTNLLALNAAIIAAQAGVHGKGFAVVADEIKELSERTSSSTREIGRLIEGVQKETQRAVEAISQAEQRIADGEVLSQKSGEALEKIVHGVQQASEQARKIARATVEQAKGSRTIREAMERVSEMVEQIATSTREQGNGSELIMIAVERMKGLTLQVKTSTQEQSKVGGFIARSTENITGMIQQIKRSSDEQARGSSQIVNAVDNIQKTTDVNVEAARIMDSAVSSLSQQIEILQREMTSFKIVKNK